MCVLPNFSVLFLVLFVLYLLNFTKCYNLFKISNPKKCCRTRTFLFPGWTHRPSVSNSYKTFRPGQKSPGEEAVTPIKRNIPLLFPQVTFCPAPATNGPYPQKQTRCGRSKNLPAAPGPSGGQTATFSAGSKPSAHP